MSSVALPRRQTSSIVLYLVLSFGGAWGFWLIAWFVSKGRLHGVDLVTTLIIGAFAPLLGALVGTLRDGGIRGALRFFARGINPKNGRRWPNKTITLGNPTTHSPEDARNEANLGKGQAVSGTDPVAARKAKAAEEQRKRSITAA